MATSDFNTYSVSTYHDLSPIPGSPTSAAATNRSNRSSSDSTGFSKNNLFMWPHRSSLAEIPVEPEEDLLALVMAAADVGLPGIGDRVYQNKICRYCVCVEIRGCHIEPFL